MQGIKFRAFIEGLLLSILDTSENEIKLFKYFMKPYVFIFFETVSKFSVFDDSKHSPSYAHLFGFIWKEISF